MELTKRELNTVLAALRILQSKPNLIPDEYWDEEILGKEEIDTLCERLNTAETKD